MLSDTQRNALPVVLCSFNIDGVQPPMKKILLLAAFSLASALCAQAAIVANYDFNDGNNSSDSDPLSTASLLTAVGFPATINTTQGNPFPSTEFRFTDIAASSTNPPGPAPTSANTDYYTFTITPAGGSTLTFNTLTFDGASLASSAGNNAFSISLQVSQNSFASNVGFAVVNNNTAFQNFSFDLSGLSPTLSATEFRLVIRDNSTSTSLGGLLDNIVVNADVMPVPEPSSYAMMGLGAALLVGIQRFRRKSS